MCWNTSRLYFPLVVPPLREAKENAWGLALFWWNADGLDSTEQNIDLFPWGIFKNSLLTVVHSWLVKIDRDLQCLFTVWKCCYFKVNRRFLDGPNPLRPELKVAPLETFPSLIVWYGVFHFHHSAYLLSTYPVPVIVLESRLTVEKTCKNSFPRAAYGAQTLRAWLQF